MYKILSPETVTVAEGAVIEDGVVIHSGNVIGGSVILRRGAVLYPNNIVEDSEIGEEAELTASVVRDAKVGRGAKVGPFANLRAGAVVGENCRVGDFVEIKNAVVGAGSKISHLAYVGDARVGENVNIGCGVVFCNFDGRSKHFTEVGSGAFIGSNANLVAPVRIGENAFVAAGTTVTRDVPAGACVIGRVRQEESEGIRKKRCKSSPGEGSRGEGGAL